MNKITLLKIIKNVLNLYLKNELNTETYDSIINNEKILFLLKILFLIMKLNLFLYYLKKFLIIK